MWAASATLRHERAAWTLMALTDWMVASGELEADYQYAIALNGDRLEERQTLVEGLPWKDYFFIHPSKAGRLPDGVFKARMAA